MENFSSIVRSRTDTSALRHTISSIVSQTLSRFHGAGCIEVACPGSDYEGQNRDSESSDKPKGLGEARLAQL